MMDRSSELALGVGYQVKNVGQPEHYQQQRSQLQPIQQQADRFKAHFPLSQIAGALDRASPACSGRLAICDQIGLLRLLIKCSSIYRPADVRKMSFVSSPYALSFSRRPSRN